MHCGEIPGSSDSSVALLGEYDNLDVEGNVVDNKGDLCRSKLRERRNNAKGGGPE